MIGTHLNNSVVCVLETGTSHTCNTCLQLVVWPSLPVLCTVCRYCWKEIKNILNIPGKSVIAQCNPVSTLVPTLFPSTCFKKNLSASVSATQLTNNGAAMFHEQLPNRRFLMASVILSVMVQFHQVLEPARKLNFIVNYFTSLRLRIWGVIYGCM